jgi:hypothetical protein
MGKIVNQAELALLLGKSDVTIWEWQKEGLPIARQGVRGTEHQYDSAEVIDWLVKRELARAGKGEKASEREARLRGDVLELELQVKRNVLVPFTEVQPTWEGRVLAAAAYMRSRASQLAGDLEAATGIEQKRALLKKADAVFLTHLGVNGARMQDEVEALLEKLAAGDAEAFLQRIASHENNKPDAEPGPGGNLV